WDGAGPVELASLSGAPSGREDLLVVADRFRWSGERATRLEEAARLAFGRGEGRLVLARGGALAPRAEREFPSPEPILFSFNSPYGVCPECKGFGDILEFDEDLIVPDPGKTLAQGAIDPWAGSWRRHFGGRLRELSKRTGIALDVPWKKLTRAQQRVVLDGGEGFR